MKFTKILWAIGLMVVTIVLILSINTMADDYFDHIYGEDINNCIEDPWYNSSIETNSLSCFIDSYLIYIIIGAIILGGILSLFMKGPEKDEIYRGGY